MSQAGVRHDRGQPARRHRLLDPERRQRIDEARGIPDEQKAGPSEAARAVLGGVARPGRAFQRRPAGHVRQVTRLPDLGGVPRRQRSGVIGPGRPRIDHHRHVAPPARHRHRPRPTVGVRLDHGVRVVPGRLSAAVDRPAFVARPRVVAPPDAHERQRRRTGLHPRTVTARHDARAPGAVENDSGGRRHRPAALVPAGDRHRAAWVATAGDRRRRSFPRHLHVPHGHARPHDRAAAPSLGQQQTVEVPPEHLMPHPPAAERRHPRRTAAPADRIAARCEKPRRVERFAHADRLEHLPAARGQRLGQRRRRGVGLRQQQDGVPPGREQAAGRRAGGTTADDRDVDRPVRSCHGSSAIPTHRTCAAIVYSIVHTMTVVSCAS